MRSKVNSDNYIAVRGWMLKELGLKGNELLIYAIIYGFSDECDKVFNGSLSYLADWTNSTKSGVQKSLKALLSKGLIKKREKRVGGVKYCEYQAVWRDGDRGGIQQSDTGIQKSNTGVQQSHIGDMQQGCTGGIQQSGTNNIDINNKYINSIEYNSDSGGDVSEVIELYNHICTSLPAVRELGKARIKAVKSILERYTLKQIEEVFRLAQSSDFLKGVDRKWRATFDWLINESNFIKVLEGTYSFAALPCPTRQENEYDRFMSSLSKFVKENE